MKPITLDTLIGNPSKQKGFYISVGGPGERPLGANDGHPFRTIVPSIAVGMDQAAKIILQSKIREDDPEQASPQDYLRNLYDRTDKPVYRKIFIQTCRHIITYFDGYENTPSWFRSTLLKLNIPGVY